MQTDFTQPIELSDVSLAFPADALDYMPSWESIPDEFKNRNVRGDWRRDLWSDIMFAGLDSIELYPKEGIDPNTAFRQLSAIVRSYAPKHEHKEAALAYLTDLWFEGATWTPTGRSRKTSLTDEELKYLEPHPSRKRP